MTVELDVDLARMCKRFRAMWARDGIRPTMPEPFGVAGVYVQLRNKAEKVAGSVIVSQASHPVTGFQAAAESHWLPEGGDPTPHVFVKGIGPVPVDGVLGPPLTDWIHASLAWDDHMPDYDDLVTLKEAVFGPDREAYQVFPPRSRHVSIHDYALHLWGRADGQNVLPVFPMAGSI